MANNIDIIFDLEGLISAKYLVKKVKESDKSLGLYVFQSRKALRSHYQVDMG